MDFVDEVGVFDGVTQAVGATERDGSGGLGEHAGGHDRCGGNDECESPHGVLLIERADRPSHRTFDRFSSKRSLNVSWLTHSSHIHVMHIRCHDIHVMRRRFLSCASAKSKRKARKKSKTETQAAQQKECGRPCDRPLPRPASCWPRVSAST